MVNLIQKFVTDELKIKSDKQCITMKVQQCNSSYEEH